MFLENIPEVQRTYERYWTSVRQNGQALRNVPDALRTYELCMTAVQQDGWRCNTFQTPCIVRSCAYKPYNKTGSAAIRPRHSENVRALLTSRAAKGYALEYVPDALRTSEMCLQAVRQIRVCAATRSRRLATSGNVHGGREAKRLCAQIRTRDVDYGRDCENGNGTACIIAIDANVMLGVAFPSSSGNVSRDACEYVEEIAATVFIDPRNCSEELAERLRKAKQRTDDALVNGFLASSPLIKSCGNVALIKCAVSVYKARNCYL